PAYAENILDDNPLNRVKQSKRPGTVWASSTGDQTEIDMNDPNEMVKIWNIGFLAFNVPGAIGNYQGNELFKHEYKDEKQNRVIEYTDKSGNLILRKVQIKANPSITHDGWLCTYNVYDKLNRLRFVIMPKVVEYMELNGWPTGIPSNMLIDLCERYLYDARGRLIEKRRPQAGTIRYVYDARDRLILTQDENQSLATAKKWSFVLYDELNREVVTGLFESAATRASLQASADALALATAQVNVSLGAGHNENVNVFAPAHALGTNIQFNSIKYYDDYSYPGAKQFTTAHRIPVSTNPDVDAVAPGNRTLGLATGSKLRVLDNTNTVLVNTAYYDQNARIVQSHSENIKGGTDVMTNQYDYANKVLISSSKHTANNTLYSNFEVLTKHDFDILGRITFLRKNFSQTVLNYKNIAEYSYDELGRMKVKKLGPNPNSGGSQVESLEYSYNLNGQLTGINKFYALKDPSRYNKWDNFFGLYLGYDNRDNAFAKAELNGNITGAMWCTQGDDDQRKFDYEYDAANQLTKALFTQKDAGTGTWVNNKFNFSVGSNHASGDIQYDASGNILQMTQMGVLPNSTPFVMDDLRYTYAAGGYSNKLERVDDVSSNTNNGALRDFKDGANGTGSGFDYVYDYNGNLVLDKNKGIEQAGGNGVKYNFLDKVEEVVIAGKGTIKYVYDASGEKLQKIFTPLSGPVKTITYINEYVYDGNDLQFIHFEEGRVRVVDVVYSYPVKFLSGNVKLPGTDKMGVFDYFVRDHLGNTRMILTDELQSAEGLCTAELSVATIEEPQFGAIQPNGQPASNNELQVTRTSILPSWNWTANPITSSNGYCVGLKNIPGAAQNPAIGPNVILKVMAGDMINARADYFYQGNASAPTSNIFQPLFGSLLSSLQSSNVSTAVKGAGITQNGWGVTNLTSFVSNQPNYGNPAAPRAYLNVLFFDEQFNYVGCADPQRVTTNNMDYVQTQANLKCPKNGYAFVYLSNETENLFVYFDNFKVEHVRGRIVEESHYYPFGLKIAAISSNKLGDPENGHLQNRFGYQGVFAEEDEYTGWNEFDLRNYDPQIGRWTGVDPYDEFSSGYVGMGNNPANLTDPSGGNIFSDVTLGGMVAIGATAGFIAGGIYDMIYNDGDLKYAFYGAMAGAAMFFITSSPVSINIQYMPTWKQVKADIGKKANGKLDDPTQSAYLAAYIRSILNEIFSFGKIVTVRGDGFRKEVTNTTTGAITEVDGQLTTKTLRYFKNHPRAKRVANALTEYHSGRMGTCANNGPDNFINPEFISKFDKNSCFMYGNCTQASNAAPTSARLNGATVIGSHTYQLDLPFLIIGRLSGN
ncbi:MAG: hypothetical protein JNM68_13450, partial [Dinghuibacter sp.]|nr:hypothetical protein [Dinghuibacter sp.]